MRIQRGKVLVLKESAQGLTERQRGMAFGKGRAGHTSGVFRHRRDEVRMPRHTRRPSRAWGEARPLSGAILCHGPLPQGTPQVRKRSGEDFFTTEIFFVVNDSKKPLSTPLPKASTPLVLLRQQWSP